MLSRCLGCLSPCPPCQCEPEPCESSVETVLSVGAGWLTTRRGRHETGPGQTWRPGERVTVDCAGRVLGSRRRVTGSTPRRSDDAPFVPPSGAFYTSQRLAPLHMPLTFAPSLFPQPLPHGPGFVGQDNSYLYSNYEGQGHGARLLPPPERYFNAENGVWDTIIGSPDHPNHLVRFPDGNFVVRVDPGSPGGMPGHAFPARVDGPVYAWKNEPGMTRYGMPNALKPLITGYAPMTGTGRPDLTVIGTGPAGFQTFSVYQTPGAHRSLIDGTETTFPEQYIGPASSDSLVTYAIREADGSVHAPSEYVSLDMRWIDPLGRGAKPNDWIYLNALLRKDGGGYVLMGYYGSWVDAGQSGEMGSGASLGGGAVVMDFTGTLMDSDVHDGTFNNYLPCLNVVGTLTELQTIFNQGGGRQHSYTHQGKPFNGPVRASGQITGDTVYANLGENIYWAAAGNAAGEQAVIAWEPDDQTVRVWHLTRGVFGPYTLDAFLDSLGYVPTETATPPAFATLDDSPSAWDWPHDRVGLGVDIEDIPSGGTQQWLFLLALYDPWRDATKAEWAAIKQRRPKTRAAYNALPPGKRPPGPEHGLVLADVTPRVLTVEYTPPTQDEEGNPIYYDPPIAEPEHYTTTITQAPRWVTKKGVYPFLRVSQVEVKQGEAWAPVPNGPALLDKQIEIDGWPDGTDDTSGLGPGTYRIHFAASWAWNPQAWVGLQGRAKGKLENITFASYWHPGPLGREVELEALPGGALREKTPRGFYPFTTAVWGDYTDAGGGPPTVTVTLGPGCKLTQLYLIPAYTYDPNSGSYEGH